MYELRKAQLVLLARRAEIAAMYHRDLEYIFQDSVQLISLTAADDSQVWAETLAHADALLITDPELADYVRHLVPGSCQIIFLQFTFNKENIQPLRELPPNTRALLCFHYYRVSLQSATILYENGIRNLLLDAYPAEIGPGPLQQNYDLAIVDNVSSAVPAGVPRVVSLGDRKLSFFTLMSICSVLRIWPKGIQSRIQAYCADSLEDLRAYLPILQRNYWDQTQIQSLMDHMESGVITLDPNYRVLAASRSLGNILSVRQNIQGLPIQNIPTLRDSADLLASDSPPENLIVENGARQKFVFSREDVPLPEDDSCQEAEHAFVPHGEYPC